jgi:hypothetical protein
MIETARAVSIAGGWFAIPLSWKACSLGEIGVSALVSRAIPSVTGVLKSASAPAAPSLSLAPLLGRFRLSTRQAERPEPVHVPDNRGVVLLLEPQRVADLSLAHLLAIEGRLRDGARVLLNRGESLRSDEMPDF